MLQRRREFTAQAFLKITPLLFSRELILIFEASVRRGLRRVQKNPDYNGNTLQSVR